MNFSLKKQYIAQLPVLMMGLSALTRQSLFCYMALGISLLLILIEPMYLFPVLMVTSLSTDYFAIADGLGATRLLSLLFIAGVSLRNYRESSSFFVEKKWIGVVVLLWAETIFTYFINENGYSSYMMRISLSVLVFICCASIHLSREETEGLILNIFTSFLLISILVAVHVITNPSITGNRYAVEGINNNRVSMMCVQLGSMIGIASLFARNRIEKVACFAGWGLNFYIIFLSGSRTGLIALVFAFLLAYLVEKKNRKESIKSILWVIIVIFLLQAVLLYLIEKYPQLGARFSLKAIVSNGGTFRWDAVLAEVKYIIPQHFFFGVGNNEGYYVAKYVGRELSSHNIVITMIARIGFIGFVLHFILVSRILKFTLVANKYNTYFIFPLILIFGALLNGIGEIVFSERLFWCDLAFAVLCINSGMYYCQNRFQSE